MSLVVVGGQIVSGGADTYQPWDPTMSMNPDAATQDNRGCAPGWATIYVQDSLTGDTVKVCRHLDAAILGPQGAAIIVEETSPDWYDQSVINVADASRHIVEALPSTWSLSALLIGAALLLFAWKK